MLEIDGREHELRDLHTTYVVDLAERAEPELLGGDQADWLRRLAAEHENLRAALAWTVGAGDEARLLRLAGALWRFWFIRGHLTEGRTWLMRAVENRAHAEPGMLADRARFAGFFADETSSPHELWVGVAHVGYRAKAAAKVAQKRPSGHSV